MGHRNVVQGLLFLVLSTFPLAAQITSGSIKGTVSDPSGAAVPNIPVTAQNIATSIETTAITNNEGTFTLVALPVGSYSVSVDIPGFKRTVVANVLVDIGVTTRTDVALQMGSRTETVDVAGGASVLTPDTAEAGTVLTAAEYQNLPLSTGGRARDPMAFVALTPGVNAYNGAGLTDTTQDQMSVNGGQAWMTDVLIDGMSAGQTNHFGSWNEMAPPVDALSEFKIITGGAFSAEYGHVGTAVVSFGLKSGTNEYRGSVFELFRNTVLNSRSFFQTQRTPYHQNNFGYELDGPVRIPHIYDGRNRTFFMTALDASIYRGIDVTQLYTSPTAAMLSGNFSGLQTATGQPVTIYDPATTVVNPSGSVSRTAFPGNVIPQARITPFAQAILALMPPPNLPGTVNNFSGPATGGSDAGGCEIENNYMFVAKGDHHFTDKQSISFDTTYTFEPSQCDNGNPYTGTALSNGSPPIQNFSSHEFRLSYTYVISPNIVNVAEIAYNRFLNPGNTFSAGQNWPSKLGISGMNGSNGSMPEMSFSTDGYPVLSAGFAMRDVEATKIVGDSIAVAKGRNNLKFGFEYHSQRHTKRNNNNGIGEFFFSSHETGLNAATGTGNSFASLLLGATDQEKVGSPVEFGSQLPYLAWFAQDDVKVSSKLTLNVGLRYEMELPPVEDHNESSEFNFTTPNPGAGNLPGAYIFAGSGAGRTGGRTFMNTYYGGIGPRFGLAYELAPSTVIRGGYGISYATTEFLITNDGWSTSATFTTPDNGNTPLYLANGIPTSWPQPPDITPTFGNGNAVTTYSADADHLPTVQNWRFGIQQQLPGKIVVEAAYVGTHGSHLALSGLSNPNQISAQYLGLGSTLTSSITSQAAKNAGIESPYSGFTGSVAQALRPYPQVQAITNYEVKLGWSTYESFQLTAQRRYAAGFQWLMSYTISKLLTNMQDNTDVSAVSTLQNTADLRAERAIAVFDVPQMFWTEAIYDLPIGPNKRFLNGGGVEGKVVGGWSLAPIVNIASGQPLSISQSNQMPIFNYGQRPNLVPGVDVRNNVGCGTQRIFNPAAFVSPGPYAFGDAVSPPIRRAELWTGDNGPDSAQKYADQ